MFNLLLIKSAGDLELVNSNIREFQTNLENKRNSKNLSLFIDVKEIGDILGETPDKLTIALQFFLQGVGNKIVYLKILFKFNA